MGPEQGNLSVDPERPGARPGLNSDRFLAPSLVLQGQVSTEGCGIEMLGDWNSGPAQKGTQKGPAQGLAAFWEGRAGTTLLVTDAL